jgi:hypothetical protein
MTTQTQTTYYLLKTAGSVGHYSLEHEIAALGEAEAIDAATRIAKDMHGSKGFYSVYIWQLTGRGIKDGATHIGVITTEVVATLARPKR